jgi:hypothetical protein
MIPVESVVLVIISPVTIPPLKIILAAIVTLIFMVTPLIAITFLIMLATLRRCGGSY